MNTKTVLIVDDDRIIREQLGKYLERSFFRTLLAADGKTALEIFAQGDIDILLLDVKLPDIDGLEVLEKVKEKKPDCEVIVITGYSTQEIAIQSLRRGAVDYIEKPINTDELSAALGRAQERLAQREELSYKNTLLVIDDDKEVVKRLKSFFEKEGYDTFGAYSGKEGLDIIENNKIDVVIADIKMPEIDGIEVLKRVKSLYPDIEVIMITGYREQELAIKSLRAGAIDYITKPVNLDELLLSVKRAQEKAIKAVAERNKVAAMVIEAIGDGLALHTIDGKLISVNPAYEKMTGYEKGELVGKDAFTLIPIMLKPEDIEKAMEAFKEALEGKVPTPITITFISKDGREIPTVFGVSFIKDAEGKPTHFISTIKDITEIKRIQKEQQLAAAAAAAAERMAELERTYNELEKSNRELKETTMQLIQSEKLSAVGELTADIVHELNQPLNSIKVICQSMLRDIKKDRYKEEDVEPDLKGIVKQIDKMADIIGHMRIFSRRTIGMTKEEVDVGILVEGAFKFIGQQLKDCNVEVKRELSLDLPKSIGDPIRLEQVILDLITNARNSVLNSGKEDKRIEIKTYKMDKQQSPIDKPAVVVEVKDNGLGVPEDLREKIFEPFFTTSKPGEGTGLGLSVAQRIIEEHKGKILLESKVGEGAIFRVILPVG